MSTRPAGPDAGMLDVDRFVRRVTGSDDAVARVDRALTLARHARRATGHVSHDDPGEDYATLLARPSLVAAEDDSITMGSGWLPRVLALLDPADWIAWACREVARVPLERLATLCGRSREALANDVVRGERLVLRQLNSDLLLLGRDPVQLVQLEHLLSELGHVVLASCATPAALRQRFANATPDLCVFDLQPVHDPLESRMLDLLRARFDCPIVLIGTARSNDGERLPPHSIVLPKPVDAQAIGRGCGRALLQLGAGVNPS